MRFCAHCVVVLSKIRKPCVMITVFNELENLLCVKCLLVRECCPWRICNNPDKFLQRNCVTGRYERYLPFNRLLWHGESLAGLSLEAVRCVHSGWLPELRAQRALNRKKVSKFECRACRVDIYRHLSFLWQGMIKPMVTTMADGHLGDPECLEIILMTTQLYRWWCNFLERCRITLF